MRNRTDFASTWASDRLWSPKPLLPLWEKHGLTKSSLRNSQPAAPNPVRADTVPYKVIEHKDTPRYGAAMFANACA